MEVEKHMEIKKVIILFKTHLDIGFTDFASNVTDKYFEKFIPNAARIAAQLREMKTDARLIWTTGSWLIHEYLRTHEGESGKAVREAIANGDISWHGLPFTTHTELMDGALFQYGLSLSEELDRRFSKKTIAAKMTDVPGHTKAIIPYLKKAGIEFLHIGVNETSAFPNVPMIFKWRADTGEEITVMCQKNYGSFAVLGDSGVAIQFAHTMDNEGVQSPEEIIRIFDELKQKYPNAEIVAGNLNDLALATREIEDQLPVITDEIGDTWIHGVGSDPTKLSMFKGLLRFYHTLPEGENKQTLARGLIMIPEHTWGFDEKSCINDHEHYERRAFEAMRQDPAYKKIEKSWREQRKYLTDAVNAMTEPYRSAAFKIISETVRRPTDTESIPRRNADEEFALGDFVFKFNPQGEIVLLKFRGISIADSKHRLLSLIYEQFCADDYKRFYSQYNRLDHYWAREDFNKIGIETASDCYRRYEPKCAEIFADESVIKIKYIFPDEAFQQFGCPEFFDMTIKAEEGRLLFDLAWFNKPANRVAEAIWIGFKPIAKNKRVIKLGKEIDPKQVVDNGQCRLHASDFGVVYDELSIQSLDTALVAPQEPSLLNFCNTKPLDDDGINFNLYNNVWGTNFPMWYDEDARFRFIIDVKHTFLKE